MNEVENRKQRVSKTTTTSFLPAIAGMCVLFGILSIAGCETGQEGGAESKSAVKQTGPEPVWGPEVNGVCAAFDFVPLKQSYEINETIGTVILIKNAGKKPVKKIKAIGKSFFGHCVITAVDPNTPKIAQVNWLQEWKSDPNQMIKPGEVLAYPGAEIQVRSFYPDGTYPPRKAPNIVYFFPGEYNIYFWLDCDRKFIIETGRRKLFITEAKE
ncbi:MAG: hypothetical protein JW749_04090 [Sedimentisphaerales bacterium]|nr:hypothetical protein [Sedimentisphaerales bacterium]